MAYPYDGNQNARKPAAPDANNMGTNGGSQVTITDAPPKVRQMVEAQQQVMTGSPDGRQQAVATVNPGGVFTTGITTKFGTISPAYGRQLVKPGTGGFATMPNNNVGQSTVQQAPQPTEQLATQPQDNGYHSNQPLQEDPYAAYGDSPILTESAAKQNGVVQPQGTVSGQPMVTNPADVRNNNYSSLKEFLYGTPKRQAPQEEEKPTYTKDPSRKDGGFFSWVKDKFSPKGMKNGETEEEYDERVTRNRQRMAVLADALRHMGNIYHTNRYAPLQLFNSPTAGIEAAYQQRKAERQNKQKMEADAAYKQMQMDLKRQAAESDKNYKDRVLGYKDAAEKRAQEKAKTDADHWDKNYNRQLENDKFNHDLAGQKFEENKRHNKVSEGQGAQRLALSQESNSIARARLAHTIAKDAADGYGSGGSHTNLSTPTGHINRKKDLNTIEKKQITQYLWKNGYINKKNQDAYNLAKEGGNNQAANDLQNYWIAYAANMPGKKGDIFRKHLKDHYLYQETTTTSTPKPVAKKNEKKSGSARSKLVI